MSDTQPTDLKPFVPCVTYFAGAGCIEYVTKDCLAVYDQIHPGLSLIYDGTGENLIGVKIDVSVFQPREPT